MTKIKQVKLSIHHIAALVGLAATLLYMLPYFIMGQNAYYTIHDNLDSEFLFNVLNADNLFKFNGTLPLFADIDVRAINTFSVIQLPLYAVFSPLTAYLISEFIVHISAFAGMYLLLNLLCELLNLNKNYIVIIIVSVLFALSPFYVMYGLTTCGIPLCLYCFINLFKKQRLVSSYILLAYFGLSSSLILSGFWICGFAVVAAIVFLCKKKYRKSYHFYIGTALLILIYAVTNIKLLSLMAGGYTSHRATQGDITLPIWAIRATSFWQVFAKMWIPFGFGAYHLGTRNSIILLCAVIALIIAGCSYFKKREEYKNRQIAKCLLILLAAALVTSFITAFAQSNFFYKFISKFGFLDGFGFDRVMHLLPTLMYLALGCSFVIIGEAIKVPALALRKQTAVSLSAVIALSLCVFLFPHLLYIKPDGRNYLLTWRLMLTGQQTTALPSYKQMYDKKLFSAVEDYIFETDGLSKTEYRVGSVGLYPVCSQMNGFYTVDGYFQNYSLEYKEKYRPVVAPELARSEFFDSYFSWGNRCYMFSSELGQNWMQSKYSEIVLEDFRFDAEAFKQLGGRYIFAGVPITDQNAAELGITFLNAFEHEDSFFKIYLYRAN